MSNLDQKTIAWSAERIEWVIGQSYPATLQRLVSILQKPRPLKIALLSRFRGPAALADYLHQVACEPGLMILGTIAHGRMLGPVGQPGRERVACPYVTLVSKVRPLDAAKSTLCHRESMK